MCVYDMCLGRTSMTRVIVTLAIYKDFFTDEWFIFVIVKYILRKWFSMYDSPLKKKESSLDLLSTIEYGDHEWWNGSQSVSM